MYISPEDVELNPLDLRLDALPSHEDPRGVEVALEQPLPDGEVRHDDLLEVARAAVALDQPLHDAALEPGAVTRTVGGTVLCQNQGWLGIKLIQFQLQFIKF